MKTTRFTAVRVVKSWAEDGGLTDFPERGCGTWVITRYKPPRAISFVDFHPDQYVEHLDLIADDWGGTRVR